MSISALCSSTLGNPSIEELTRYKASLVLFIKDCIICWKYLYLSQKFEEIEDAATRRVFLDAVAHGSVISWQHINLLGEYDFSDEKLQDNVGIRPPKIDHLKWSKIWGLRKRVMCFSHRDL